MHLSRPTATEVPNATRECDEGPCQAGNSIGGPRPGLPRRYALLPVNLAERILPGLGVLRNYRRDSLAPDLFAGIAVCVLSIPMSVACSGLIGVEPRQGLFAALVGLVAYALFTSSRLVVVGPDTAVAILVAGAVRPWANGDPGRIASLAALVAILAGLLMVLMAAARLGAVADFLSRPVLVGFMNGAALIVITAQLGKLFGLKLAGQDFLDVIREIWHRLDQVHWGTAGLGLGFLGTILVVRHFFPRAPGALGIFVLAIAVSFLFDLEGRGVAMVGAIPSALPTPGLPDISLQDLARLLPAAVGIAFLTFPEAILLARAFGGRGADIEPNREVLALGAVNVFSGVFHGFSIAASSTRTSMSTAAGGRTQVAHLFAALFLVGFLLVLTPVISHLPIVALASILIYAGLRLIDVATLRLLGHMSWKSGAIAVLTTLGVLVVGVIPGILVGVLLSLIVVIHKVSRPPDAVLRQVEGRKGLHDIADDDGGNLVPGLLAYRFYAPLIFSNVNCFVERIETLVLASDPPPRCVLLDAQAISDIDVTAAEQVLALVQDLRTRGITFLLANANRPLRAKLELYGLIEGLGVDHVQRSVNNALKAFLAGPGTDAVIPSTTQDEDVRREAGPVSPMKIVVAFNDSEDSRAAVACAAEIARHSGGDVHLAYAIPAPAIPAFSSAHLVEALMVAASAGATKLIEAAAAELRASGVTTTTLVRRWLPVDTALDRAKEVGAGLIVVGRRGSSRVTQLLIGTVSSELVRLSPVSVLVVRKGDQLKGGSVLVAIDGSPHGVRALVVARATFPAARLVACHVDPKEGAASAHTIGAAVLAAGLDPKTVTERMLRGDPATELLAELEKEDCAAVALGPRGLGPLKGLLLGSVTEKVLQLAKRPVLVAR